MPSQEGIFYFLLNESRGDEVVMPSIRLYTNSAEIKQIGIPIPGFVPAPA